MRGEEREEAMVQHGAPVFYLYQIVSSPHSRSIICPETSYSFSPRTRRAGALFGLQVLVHPISTRILPSTDTGDRALVCRVTGGCPLVSNKISMTTISSTMLRADMWSSVVNFSRRVSSLCPSHRRACHFFPRRLNVHRRSERRERRVRPGSGRWYSCSER